MEEMGKREHHKGSFILGKARWDIKAEHLNQVQNG